MKNRLYQSLFLGITSAIAASASYALMPPQNFETPTSIETLATPSIAPVEQNLAKSIKYSIVSGDNLSIIFEKIAKKNARYQLSPAVLDKITSANKDMKVNFADLAVNKILNIEINEKGELEGLVYKKNMAQTLIATRLDDNFEIKIESKEIYQEEILTQGTIHTSLYDDGMKEGLSINIINQLADKIFAWDIDFKQDFQKGDKFTVIYEQSLIEGERYDTGQILAAEFVMSGKSYSAVRFKNEKGKFEYYSPQGKKVRKVQKTFLRSPIEFARISSHFNPHRKHPIFKTTRPHKGVDYAAKSGTPIRTVGDGKITFRGKQRGYGNVVIIQHGKKYSSLYAHLSKFKTNQKVGSAIKQGEEIGYVGRTGYATGPHLHYEFRVNGIHKNPLTIALPRIEPDNNKKFLAEFKRQTQDYIAQLNSATTETAAIKIESLLPQKTR